MHFTTPLISIVVPIYNVEEYLPRCLDSITGQTYRNIEIMLVDDGSPDGAGAICDEYATRDERIRVFHIPNGGVAKARQLGVEQSTGEYIVFVDPDDWLPLDSVATLYSHMSDDVDIVIGGYTKVEQNTEIYFTCKNKSDRDLLHFVMLAKVTPMPWAKLYRRCLFNEDSFPNFKKSQDWLMFIDICTRVKGVRFIDQNTYYYLNRDTSTVNTYRTSIENELSFIETCRQTLKNNNKYINHLSEFHHFAISCLFRVINQGDKIYRSNIGTNRLISEIKIKSLTFKNLVKYAILRCVYLQSILQNLTLK